MRNPGCSEGNTHPDIARIHTQYVSTRAGVRGRSYQQAGYDKDARQCWQGAGRGSWRQQIGRFASQSALAYFFCSITTRHPKTRTHEYRWCGTTTC